MENNQGLLVVLSGPSGAGKDTVLKRLLEKDEKIKLSISATTREPREGEVHGEHYYFLSKSEFVQLISKNGFLEHAQYCGNYYGTPLDEVKQWTDKGRDVVLEIEVKGGSQIRETCPESVSIFIMPPSLKVLSERLVNRATEPKEIIDERLLVAREEIKCAIFYDYIVINDSVDECVDNIIKIINNEKIKITKVKNLIEEVLEDE